MATAYEKIINLMKEAYGKPVKGGITADQTTASGIAGLARLEGGTNFGANTPLQNGWTTASESDWEDVRAIADRWAASSDPNTAQWGKQLLSYVPGKPAALQVTESGDKAVNMSTMETDAQLGVIGANTGTINKASDLAATNVEIGLGGQRTAQGLNDVALQNKITQNNQAWDTQTANIEKVLGGEVAGQKAAQEFVVNGPGIWGQIKDIAEAQMNSSLADLTRIAAIARSNVESARVALNEQEKADFEGVVEGIEAGVAASRTKTREEMNARGMFFATLLDGAMGVVEAQGNRDVSQARAQNKARRAKIASDMAIMSGNIDIEMIKGNAQATAQYTATMLQYVARDAETKQAAGAILAGLNAQYGPNGENIAAIAATQTFSGRMASNQPYEAAQLEGKMALNTAESMLPYNQNLAREPYNQLNVQNELEGNRITGMATVTAEQARMAAEGATSTALAEAQQLAFENNMSLEELNLKLAQFGLDQDTFTALYGKDGIEQQKLAMQRARDLVDANYKGGMLGLAQSRAYADLQGEGAPSPAELRAAREQILKEIGNPDLPQSVRERKMMEFLSLDQFLQSKNYENFLFGVETTFDSNGKPMIGSTGLLNLDDPAAAIDYIENMPNNSRALESLVFVGLNYGAGNFSDEWVDSVKSTSGISSTEQMNSLNFFVRLANSYSGTNIQMPTRTQDVDTLWAKLDKMDWKKIINAYRTNVPLRSTPTDTYDKGDAATRAGVLADKLELIRMGNGDNTVTQEQYAQAYKDVYGSFPK